MTDDAVTYFADLPRDAFPIVLEFYEEERMVHRIEIPDAGMVEIPALKRPDGPVITVRMVCANGEVATA